MNFRASLVSGAIAIAVYFVTNPTAPLGRVVGYMSESEAMGFGFAAFIICAIVLHAKPELMGKSNHSKTDRDDTEAPPEDGDK